MINYLYDCYTILNKVYSEKTYIKQAISSTIIEEKNRALTVKTCYGVLDKDIELSYYLSKLTEKTPKLAIRTLLKISMYAIKHLGKKGYAVTENAVALTKKLGKKGASGFVNAFLRKFLSVEIPFPKKEIDYLSIKYSYPQFAVEELIDDYGRQVAEEILSSENVKTTLCFYGANGEKYLTERGVNFEKTPFENVYTAKNFVRDEGFDKGIYTFQAVGSVAICEAIKEGDKLLDCCSAPGGKSIRLSSKFKEITSWDIHPHRVDLITAYKTRMGVTNVTEEVKNAEEFYPECVERFDAVLCDAPCSGLGVVNDNPDIKLNRTKENVLELNKTQYLILNTVKNYVKKGGYLYYSTCSVLKSENDRIIEKFIEENKEFSLCDIQSKLECVKTPFGLQFLPHISGGLGFFVTALRKGE